MGTSRNGVPEAWQNVPPSDQQCEQRVHWVGDWRWSIFLYAVFEVQGFHYPPKGLRDHGPCERGCQLLYLALDKPDNS